MPTLSTLDTGLYSIYRTQGVKARIKRGVLLKSSRKLISENTWRTVNFYYGLGWYINLPGKEPFAGSEYGLCMNALLPRAAQAWRV